MFESPAGRVEGTKVIENGHLIVYFKVNLLKQSSEELKLKLSEDEVTYAAWLTPDQ